MKSECEVFLNALGGIPRNELLHVKTVLTAYLATSGRNDVSAELIGDPEALLVVDAFLAVLKGKGLHSGSRPALVKSRVFRGNRSKLNTVIEWASPVRDKLARVVLYQIAFRRLHKYLVDGLPTRWDEERGFLARNRGPVGVREMLIFLDYVPSVMEAAFPGYADSGLLGMIPKSEKRANYKRL